MRCVWLPALLALALPTAAGEALIEDGTSDVTTSPGVPAQEPWRDAVDVVDFDVAWEDGQVVFRYAFVDLAALEDATAADAAGKSFWSNTDFTVVRPGGAEEYSLYMDHNGNPLYETGWRFYMHESREDVVGDPDLEASVIAVRIDPSHLGGLAAGDLLQDFSIQASTTISYPAYSTDWAPDSGPCSCSYTIPGDGGDDGAPEGEPDDARSTGEGGNQSASGGNASDAGGDASDGGDGGQDGRDGTSGSDGPAGPSPSNASPDANAHVESDADASNATPGPGALILLALAGAARMAARRR